MKNPVFLMLLLALPTIGFAADPYETEAIPVEEGEVTITFIGHATLMFEYMGSVIHIDPVRSEGDYDLLPDADIVLVTHEHGDHYDRRAINQIRKPDTAVIHNVGTTDAIDSGTLLANGAITTVGDITIEAVPAYNTTAGRSRFHPIGRDNGYIITLGGKRFYIAGDTEDTDEMLALESIYVAFLPANQPFTMVPDQVIRAATAFRPTILYPYHYGRTDLTPISDAFARDSDIEVRIRSLQ